MERHLHIRDRQMPGVVHDRAVGLSLCRLNRDKNIYLPLILVLMNLGTYLEVGLSRLRDTLLRTWRNNGHAQEKVGALTIMWIAGSTSQPKTMK